MKPKPNPPMPLPPHGTEAAGDAVEVLVRRPLASADPDVLALYERLVIAREGARSFKEAALIEEQLDWYARASEIEFLVDRAQQLVEDLR